MTFWIGFAAGLAVEGLALWALVAWADRHERKELESHLPEARSFIEAKPFRYEFRFLGIRFSHNAGPSHNPGQGEYL